ncbi:MAG: hypothetical protein JSV84_03995, partial [Gemmatimonadota bacterium]
SDEEPFAVSRSDWDLSQSGGNDPSGVKRVYATLKDVVGNWSDLFFDEIVYNAPLQILTLSFGEGTVGSVYAETLYASGGWPPYNWEVAGGEFPPGLSLDGSGVISGVPDSPATFHFTVRVIDSNMKSVMKNLSITVEERPVAALVELFIPTVYGLPGHQVNVTLNLDNEKHAIEPVAGLEAKFTFPFDLLTVLDLYPTSRTNHMDFFNWNEPEPGRINVLVSDFSADVIAPGTGAVIGITCDISEDAVAGDSLLFHFVRVVLSDDTADSIPSIVSDGFLIVGPGAIITGDANLDGEIDILDALFIVNIIIELVTPSNEHLQAADCNQDGIVNILDLIGVVNVILGIGSCPPG